MRKILTTLATTGLLATALNANATTTTASFLVSATVQKTCSVSASALSFNTYTPGSGALTANTTLSVKCTKTTPFTVSLNGGTTAGGTVSQRLMTAGASETLQYNLYTTSALSTVFGDGTAATSTVAGTGAGVNTATAVTVYGQLPDNTVNQGAAPANYSDTVTVTVTY